MAFPPKRYLPVGGEITGGDALPSGYRNRLGHPRPEIVARYQEQGIRLLRSDFDGAVEVRFDGGEPRIRAWRETDGPYWRDRPVRADSTPLE